MRVRVTTSYGSIREYSKAAYQERDGFLVLYRKREITLAAGGKRERTEEFCRFAPGYWRCVEIHEEAE